MKLFAPIYISPNPLQGEFKNVTIQEVMITHKVRENSLIIQFDMTYNRDGKKILIASKNMHFYGLEGDVNSSNKTTFVRVDNPNYNSETNYLIEEPNPNWVDGGENLDSEGNPIPEFIIVDTTPPLKITIPLFKKDGSLNVSSMDFEVVDFGYPTYEKAIQMFHGGSFLDPEITITEPLAIGFVLSKLNINGQAVGAQFQLIND